MKFSLFILTVLISTTVGFRLSNIFGNQMVLQMGPKRAQIFGFGTADAMVTVTLAGSSPVQTRVKSDGTWSLLLSPHAPGGPYTLRATQGFRSVSIAVWFGDVWFCSGQGNMMASMNMVINSTLEIAIASRYRNIRLFQVGRRSSTKEENELLDISIPWSAPTEENVRDFSAICLMYAQRMSDSLGSEHPIGVIQSSASASNIACWSSARTTKHCGNREIISYRFCNTNSLWNAMVYPLTKAAIKGVIWWQGEEDIQMNNNNYVCLLKSLINDWRTTFVDGDVPVPCENNVKFPFGIVQLGATDYSNEGLGYIRWDQSLGIGYLPNIELTDTFMASAYDTWDPESFFTDTSRYKAIVADRLSRAAKRLLWNENYLPYGPKPIRISKVINNTITIYYDLEMSIRSKSPGFTMLTSNGWKHTNIIEATSTSTKIRLDPTATKLAYAWNSTVCDYLQCALYSDDKEKLPALPWIWDINLIGIN